MGEPLSPLPPRILCALGIPSPAPASPLQLRTNSLVTMTTVGSHEALPMQHSPTPAQSTACGAFASYLGLQGCHQASPFGLGAWRKLQNAVESWSGKKPARMGITSFTLLLGKEMDAESSWDAGREKWQSLAVLRARADVEVTPPRGHKPMLEPGLQP